MAWTAAVAAVVLLAGAAVGGRAFDPSGATQLSWHPRVFRYEGFLSEEECDHMIELARNKLEKSTVVDDETGKSVLDDVRTSSGMFLVKRQDKIIAEIEKRLAAWTFLPEENGEAIQILRYEDGQKYEPHSDYFDDEINQATGGQRVATVLMYLSNVKKGGETVFPDAQGNHFQEKDDSWSDCARRGLAVKPKKGDALLFFNLHPNATADAESLHGSCPVIEGEKWSATRWIRVRSFDSLPQDGCEDSNDFCPQWAGNGECTKNPAYMAGHCRRSCGLC